MATFKVINRRGQFLDSNSYRDAVNYICQLEKVKTSMNILTGGVLPDYPVESMEFIAAQHRQCKGRRLIHSELAFDPQKEKHITPGLARHIAQALIDYIEDEYQIVAAIHEDTDHLHIHFVMSTVNIKTGRKYRGTKKDYYDLCNHLCRVAKKYGVKVIPLSNKEDVSA